jgi:hypothetical protein
MDARARALAELYAERYVPFRNALVAASIPLVWVSKPVETAFFVYGVPRPHWRAGRLPTTLTLRAANGKELARHEITGIL